ncbi:MAG: Glutamate 5-kinase [Syntrophorhabdus sp. PtaB.Bin184]|jgi:glutamate 5-kinase|nr:MAG: Glutamate 5-kinase [Syntrophorhabdus sp. PtaB.Bin184]
MKKSGARMNRLVIKIGTSVLLDEKKRISTGRIGDIARQVRKVKEKGIDVIIVSSGAIGCGMETVGLARKPKEIAKRQALASIGQVLLMKMYRENFEKKNMKVSQILLTHEDIKNRTRCLNLTNTLDTLLKMDIVPVINENDALSFTEIKFGDNDNLSALIAQIATADLLLILSDVEGLFDRDPNRYPGAKMIPVVHRIDEEIEGTAAQSASEKSVGGMVSKLEAAKKAGLYGIPTRVVLGGSKDVILRVVEGREVGTLFLPGRKLARRKWWTAFAFKPKGVILIDEGAERAVVDNGKSLLPSGVVRIDGHFTSGDCVEMKNVSGTVVARGIANYSSSEMDRIKGLKSLDIEKELGYKYTEEVVHRDNMVVI